MLPLLYSISLQKVVDKTLCVGKTIGLPLFMVRWRGCPRRGQISRSIIFRANSYASRIACFHVERISDKYKNWKSVRWQTYVILPPHIFFIPFAQRHEICICCFHERRALSVNLIPFSHEAGCGQSKQSCRCRRLLLLCLQKKLIRYLPREKAMNRHRFGSNFHLPTTTRNKPRRVQFVRF